VVTVVERKTSLVRGPIHRATKKLTLARTIKLLRAERDRVKTITADNGTEFNNCRELENILGRRYILRRRTVPRSAAPT
jgi:IS30 family transposase